MARRRCARCKNLRELGVDGQVFYHGELEFSVTKARALVQAYPRDLVTIRPDLAVAALGDITLAHVAHVDTTHPPIAVREGRELVFIDGNHRVAASLCKRMPIKVYMLTAKERKAILDVQ
jgi:hypothetical protein